MDLFQVGQLVNDVKYKNNRNIKTFYFGFIYIYT